MSYIALYRKYRPNDFDSIIGQEHIVRVLKNQIKSRNISHAYLFTGTRGTGKTSAAKIFAKAVNCLNPKNGSPCGQCAVCKELDLANSLDVLEIDAASNNGVDEVRDIRDKVKYPPSTGQYKVYIIDEVHMLSAGAFNALLKTLEEPPSHIIFILATTEVHKLPQTILSRCMRFDFRLVGTEKIAELIRGIFSDCDKEFEEEAITAIASAGEGSVRDALSIADMCMSYRNNKLTYKDVLEIIGASSPDIIIDLIDSALSNKFSNVFEIIEDCASSGRNFLQLSRDVTRYLRDLLYMKSSNLRLELPDDIYNRLLSVSKKYDTIRLLSALEHLCKLEGTLRYSIQPRVAFESSMLRASLLGNELDNDAIARLNTLEEKIENILKNNINRQSNQIVDNKKNSINAEDSISQKQEYEEETKDNNQVVLNADDNKLTQEDSIVEDKESQQNDQSQDMSLNGLESADDVNVVFGAVKRIYKGEEKAKEIIGKVLRELRKQKLYHLHGIFGYNDVKVWIEDNKYYIKTLDDYGYNQLTEKQNNMRLTQELMKASDNTIEKLVILPPSSGEDIDKSIDKVKELFDKDILNIKK